MAHTAFHSILMVFCANTPVCGSWRGRRPASPALGQPRLHPHAADPAGCARCRCSCGLGAQTHIVAVSLQQLPEGTLQRATPRILLGTNTE
eukprot:122068-Pelagomonas_calceolata.AAC.2